MKASHWIKHLLIYGSGVLLMNALPFLLVPVYARAIAPAEYGVLELLSRSQEILLLLATLGLRSTLLTYYQMERGNPAAQQRLYSTALQFLVAAGAVLFTAFALASRQCAQLLFSAPGYTTDVLIIIVCTYLETLFQIAVLFLQSEMRSALYVAFHTARALVAIGLNIFLVTYLHMGLRGILYAMLIHTSLFTIGIVVYTFRHTGFGFGWSELRSMLKFGLPMVPGAIAMFALNNGDRYFLNAYASREQVGVYSLGYKFGMLAMYAVLMPFGKIWSVSMVDMSRAPDGSKVLGRTATYVIAAMTFCTLGVSLFTRPVLTVVSTPAYWDAWKIVPLVGAAYLFYGWTMIIDASFYVSKKTIYKPVTVGLGGLAVMALYWYLIPRYASMGAAWATLAGFAIFGLVSLAFAQRVLRIEYEYARLVGIVGTGVLLYLAKVAAVAYSVGPDLLVSALLTLLFPVILWNSPILSGEERRQMKDYVASVLRKTGAAKRTASATG